jgi:hypothetical protein
VPPARGSTRPTTSRGYAAEGIGGLDDRPNPGRLRWTDDMAVVLATLEPPPQWLGGAALVEPAAGCRAGPVECQGGQGMAGVADP